MNHINTLKELHMEKSKYTHPELPDYVRTYPTFLARIRQTNGLTQAIIHWFILHGWFAERISTMGRLIDNRQIVTDVIGRAKMIGSKKWIKGTGTTGSADISAKVDGRSISVEVKNKSTKDRVSPNQESYKQMALFSGAMYYIAKDFESFCDWYNDQGYGFNTIENRHLLWDELKRREDGYIETIQTKCPHCGETVYIENGVKYCTWCFKKF